MANCITAYLQQRVLVVTKPKIHFFMKTIQKSGAYNTPILREVNCRVEAGFAASTPSGFDDLDFEGRDEE